VLVAVDGFELTVSVADGDVDDWLPRREDDLVGGWARGTAWFNMAA